VALVRAGSARHREAAVPVGHERSPDDVADWYARSFGSDDGSVIRLVIGAGLAALAAVVVVLFTDRSAGP
jgi:hypothetical protein